MAIQESTNRGGQSRSSFIRLLKIDYAPMWELHVHTKVVIAKYIAKKVGRIGAKMQLAAVVDALPQSAGVAGFENAKLVNPTTGTYFNPTLSTVDLYSRLRWTGKVEREARAGGAWAWARPRALDMKHARMQFDLNFARMLYLGPYQPLAKISAYDAGTATATLYGRNTRTSLAADWWNFGAHYLKPGMAIQTAATVAGNPAWSSGTQVGSENEVTIESIDASDIDAPTVTFSEDPEDAGGINSAGQDENWIIPYASRRNTVTTDADEGITNITDFAGPFGLAQGVTDDQIYGGIYELNRGDYPTLQGVRQVGNPAGTARAFAENYLMMLVDAIADGGTGQEPDVLICDRSMRREVVREHQEQQRFLPVQTESGFVGDMKYQAGDAILPYKVDRDCPPGMFFALDSSGFGWLENSAMGPIDETSERWVDGEDAHEIIMHKSGNGYTETPFNNGTAEDFSYRVNTLTP